MQDAGRKVGCSGTTVVGRWGGNRLRCGLLSGGGASERRWALVQRMRVPALWAKFGGHESRNKRHVRALWLSEEALDRGDGGDGAAVAESEHHWQHCSDERHAPLKVGRHDPAVGLRRCLGDGATLAQTSRAEQHLDWTAEQLGGAAGLGAEFIGRLRQVHRQCVHLRRACAARGDCLQAVQAPRCDYEDGSAGRELPGERFAKARGGACEQHPFALPETGRRRHQAHNRQHRSGRRRAAVGAARKA